MTDTPSPPTLVPPSPDIERGWWHPERGYWQTIGAVSADIISGYPSGTVEVPVRPVGIFSWSGTEWVPAAPPPSTADDVKREAQRRIIVRSGSTTLERAMTRQLNATMRAIELTRKQLAGGLTEAEAAEAVALQGLADDIKAIRARSDQIEQMSPIPSDVTADALWSGE